MTYDDAMVDLNFAAYAALRAAIAADAAPVDALRNLCAEIDCLIDTGCTRAEFDAHKALHNGAKLAGLV